MATYQSPLTVIIKGAVAGAAGTAAMSAAMERAPDFLSQLGMRVPPTPPGRTDPDAPTEAAGEPVGATEPIQWAYGAAWGACYAIIQSSLKPPPLVHGPVFGAVVGTVAATVIPRLGLRGPASHDPPRTDPMHVAGHLVYGVSTAIAYAILNLGRRG